MRFWPESQVTAGDDGEVAGGGPVLGGEAKVMELHEEDEVLTTEEFTSGDDNRKSIIRRLFYVNRNDFKVNTDPNDRPIRKVWGNVISQIVTSNKSKTDSEASPGIEGIQGENGGVTEESQPSSSTSSNTSSQKKQSTVSNTALGFIRKLPTAVGQPILKKFASEDFKLPSEYADETSEAISDFDPDAIYILPIIGVEHIYEKRKTIVLRRDMFNAKHVKSTFNIVDHRNKFHFRVEAELYDLRRERVLTNKDGVPTMGLRYDFMRSMWHVLAGSNLTERRALISVKKGLFGKSCLVYVHLPPFPLAIEEPCLDGIKPFLRVKGSSIEKGFEVWNISEDKRWARIQKDLEYLTHWTFGTDSYYVEVQPYIDTALMIAVGIVMEEETTTTRERPYVTGNIFKDVLIQVADNVYR